MPPGATSSHPAASRSRPCAPSPAGITAGTCRPRTGSTAAAGSGRPTGLVELYSQALAEHGQPALPTFAEPPLSPRSRPELAAEYPLVLTCAKSLRYCETQHRQVEELRRAVPDPQVEVHPDTAAVRGISAGDWVRIITPHGAVSARARLNPGIDPRVVCGQHGWWQGCDALDLPPSDPFEVGGVNLNLVLRQSPSDPVSGSSPLRASLCQLARQ